MADIRINSLPSTATSFNTDDYIPIDGASGGTRKMLAATLPLTDVKFGGASGPSAKSSIAARAPRQGLVFDGTNSATVSVPAFGTSAWTVSFWVNLNSLRNYDGLFGGASGAFTGYTDASGNLAIGKSGVGSITVSSYFPSALKTYLVTITNDGTTATIYRDGVSITTSTSANIIANYTAGIVAFGSNNNANANPLAGSLSGALVYNRALSAAEVVSLYEAGVPSGADYNSAGTLASWSAYNLISVTDNGGGSYTFASGGNAFSTTAIYTAGKRYRVSFNVTAITGSISLWDGSGWVATGITTTGAKTYDITASANGSFGIYVPSGTATITGLAPGVPVTKLGLLLAPDAAQAGGGLTWYDTSGNAANITLPASGVSWNVPSSLKTASGWTFGGTVTGSVAGPSLGTGVNTQNFLASAASGFVGYSLRRTDDTNGGWLIGTSAAVVGDFAIYQNQGASTVPVQRLLIGTTGNTTLAGNLTVSGGTIQLTDGTTFTAQLKSGGSGVALLTGTPGTNAFAYGNGSVAEVFRTTNAGNVLIGTTTDSGNGKLQLATHTTSAGGIGFGTATSLYTEAAGTLSLNHSAGDARLYFYNAGTAQGKIESASSSFYVTASAGSLILRSGGPVTALTLDSSQNATFAGAVTVNGANGFAVGTASPFGLAATKFSFSSAQSYVSMAISGAAGTGAVIELGDGSSRRAQINGELDGSGTNGKMILRTFSSSTGNVATAVTIDSSQRTILSGALRLNNAYVAGAPTATGYVTIQDSAGNTYKVLVGT